MGVAIVILFIWAILGMYKTFCIEERIEKLEQAKQEEPNHDTTKDR